jgi:hypothetical protein
MNFYTIWGIREGIIPIDNINADIIINIHIRKNGFPNHFWHEVKFIYSPVTVKHNEHITCVPFKE